MNRYIRPLGQVSAIWVGGGALKPWTIIPLCSSMRGKVPMNLQEKYETCYYRLIDNHNFLQCFYYSMDLKLKKV